MIAALICLQAPGLTQQPLTVEVVSYQRVQHALPNGAPDLNAPDNHYIKVRLRYVLAVDSDALTADEKGLRHVDAPERRFSYIESFAASGDARGYLAEAFKEVSSARTFGRRQVGEVTFGRDQQTVSRGARYVAYFCKTTTEEVETHSDRGDRGTRTFGRES